LASYKEAIYQPDLYSPDCTGSLLLSVFRGKFSEGIDFKDELARAVICIGIPLPNIMNYFVKEKMQFNNDLCKTNGSTILSGNEWYRTQAFRALNQSLGR
jgi:fanconi anemia group J protein